MSKPNSSNGDLWLWILNSVERLGLDNIQVSKVQAHQKLENRCQSLGSLEMVEQWSGRPSCSYE